MDKHHELGPSNYSVWAVCPSAELSGGETKESAEGTAVHQQIQMALDGIEDAEDYRATWAVRTLTELDGDNPIASEQMVSGEVGEFGTIFGTVDAMWIDGGVRHIADFKTFATFGAEHIPQLMGYGALAGKPGESIVLHVLCGGSLTVHTVETTYEECLKSTLLILTAHKDGGYAVANGKCKYCIKCGTCAACSSAVASISPGAVAASRFIPWRLLTRNALRVPCVFFVIISTIRWLSPTASASTARSVRRAPLAKLP